MDRFPSIKTAGNPGRMNSKTFHVVLFETSAPLR